MPVLESPEIFTATKEHPRSDYDPEHQGTTGKSSKMMNTGKDYKHDMAMMLAFHDALRRELGHIARVAAERTDDPRQVMATAAGWQMFKTYLHVHHGCFGLEHGKRTGPEAPRVFPWMLDGLDEAKTQHIRQLVPEPLRATYHNQWLVSYRQLDRWGLPSGSAERVS